MESTEAQNSLLSIHLNSAFRRVLFEWQIRLAALATKNPQPVFSQLLAPGKNVRATLTCSDSLVDVTDETARFHPTSEGAVTQGS